MMKQMSSMAAITSPARCRSLQSRYQGELELLGVSGHHRHSRVSTADVLWCILPPAILMEALNTAASAQLLNSEGSTPCCRHTFLKLW